MPNLIEAVIDAPAIALPQKDLTAGTMTYMDKAAVTRTVHRFQWTNAMITAIGGVVSGDIKVCTLPAKTVVTNVYVILLSPDTSTNALTVAVGRTSATYIDYIVASNAKGTAGTVYGDASAERGTNLTGYDLPSTTAATDVYAHFVKTTTYLNTVVGCTGAVILETMQIP